MIFERSNIHCVKLTSLRCYPYRIVLESSEVEAEVVPRPDYRNLGFAAAQAGSGNQDAHA